MKKISIILISIIMSLMFVLSSCVFTAPDSFTPSEKVQFTTMKGLTTAHDFRIFALESSKIIWDKGLMSVEDKDKIVELGDAFQKAINEASLSLEIYRKSDGLNSSDLESKINLYQKIYLQFNGLVLPYIIKHVGD